MATHKLKLSTLSPEILLQILTHLDLPDLHALTLTSSSLRLLACDPLLHLQRLHSVPYTLTHALSHRPSRRSLVPPLSRIYLTRIAALRLRIAKSLIRIRVNHALSLRPQATDLILRGVLPHSYAAVAPRLIATSLDIQRRRVRDVVGRKLERRPSVSSLVQRCILPEECRPGAVSPVLVEARRRVTRERLKDGLRRWVQGRGVEAQRERSEEEEGQGVSVRAVVRRLQARRGSMDDVAAEKKKAQRAWGAEAERERERARNQPTRAHVLGLKRFWEGVIRTAAG
jgi:hypothetical protein